MSEKPDTRSAATPAPAAPHGPPGPAAPPDNPPDEPPPSGPGRAPRVSLSIIDAAGGLTPDDLRWLQGRTRAALEHLALRGTLAVRIARDDEVAAAHLRHLGAQGTTDVITFDLTEGRPNGAGARIDADLLVCLDEARRQARDRDIPVTRELLLYIIHGVLHCLGHDDHDDERADEMHRTEDRILRELGVGETYAAPHRSRAPC